MEWEKQHQEQKGHLLQQIIEANPLTPPLPPLRSASSGGGGGGEEAPTGFVKVMTDEQLKILQKQIAAYATICEQLVVLHRSLTSSSSSSSAYHGGEPNSDYVLRNNSIVNLYSSNSFNMGPTHNYYPNQYNYYGQPKFPRRQRWNPTPEQLQILENIFDQGNEAPSKERIKEITSELAKHGQIADSNVYNWFQNRRARFKKKHTMASISESEGEMVSETSSKSVGEIPKSWEQLTNNADHQISICSDKDTMQEGPSQQEEPLFPTEDSLAAPDGGDDGADHGGGDDSFEDMAGRMLEVNPEPYYPYSIQEEAYRSIE